MAVVMKYGTGYKDPASRLSVNAVYAQADTRTINSKVDVANGDSADSQYFIGQVPSNAIIDPRSAFYYTAITGLSNVDVGFRNDPDALVDGDTFVSAGAQTLAGHGTLTVANMNKRAWELAGYSSDPGGVLDVILTIHNNATAAGSVVFALDFGK